MKLVSWSLVFKKGWDKFFKKFDSSVQKKILKKFNKMKHSLQARGLKSSRVVVEEVGQYRIAFYQNEEFKIKEIHFVGTHKQYEKWFSEL